jgi:hypothetical protein
VTLTTDEGYVQSRLRLDYGELGYRLWRNNVGVLPDRTGRPVRYGLANETPAMNRAFKSGDLVGWRPVLITPEMVGKLLAQFVSLEAKRPKGRVMEAQERWRDLVNAAGGYAVISDGR